MKHPFNSKEFIDIFILLVSLVNRYVKRRGHADKVRREKKHTVHNSTDRGDRKI